MKTLTTRTACLGLSGLLLAVLSIADCGPGGASSEADACAQATCQGGDGCCPDGCDTLRDPDCAPVCGNGIVEPGETCEASCPQDCDDANACTADRLVGDPAHCVAACVHEPVATCESGDGCCPAGCDALRDDDCSATCGNGVLEPGETCEGACVQSCDDGDSCTIDTLTGSAATCNADCSRERIAWCADGDGCCPAGCSALTDEDCQPACGNGVTEPGETCEPAAGDCPRSEAVCDDDDVCTHDVLEGLAADCDARCAHYRVGFCIDADGCCPDGCDANNDDDCQPVCGNGVVEPGETCDGDCPRNPGDCEDGDGCTQANVFGDPDGCHSSCGVQNPILACRHGDGCCPDGCDQLTDDDCDPCPLGSHPCPQGCCPWDQQVVEQARVSYSTGLAFDSYDRPRLVYGVQGTSFHYARWQGAGWQIIDGPPSVGECGHHVLALDGQDRPHVVWSDRGDQKLHYATWDGDGWSTNEIEVGDYGLDDTPFALVLQASGRPIIAYRDAIGDRLRLTALGDAWFTTTIDDAPWAGTSLAMARDAQGDLHVAYTKLSNKAVMYGFNDGGGWQLEQVGTFAFNDSEVALSLVPGEQARIAFHRQDGLVVLRREPQSWPVDLVHPCQDCSLHGIKMVDDPQASGHLIFIEDQTGSLFYARRTAGHWVRLEVVGGAAATSRPGLALDGQGAPAIGTDMSIPDRVSLLRW